MLRRGGGEGRGGAGGGGLEGEGGVMMVYFGGIDLDSYSGSLSPGFTTREVSRKAVSIQIIIGKRQL